MNFCNLSFSWFNMLVNVCIHLKVFLQEYKGGTMVSIPDVLKAGYFDCEEHASTRF